MSKKQEKKSKKRLVLIFLPIVLIGLCAAVLLIIHQKDKEALYTAYAERYAEEYGVPLSTVLAVIRTESNFNPKAQSGAGACGLMQMMPATFEEMAQRAQADADEKDIFDPETNIRLGTYYLSWLYGYFGDWDLVFAAYNAGAGRVKQWLATPKYTDESGKLTEIPFTETREYVKKIHFYIEYYESQTQD